MSTSNGVIKEVGNKNGISWATIKRRRRRSSDSSLDIPLEDFRGFTKVPRVELVRSDITPYLNKLYNKKTSDVSKHTDSLDTSIHHLRLSQKCTVSLVNQDLEKLKKTFLSQPRRHDSTDSVSDLENDMSTIVKCKICEKAYSSDRKLQKHQENKHMIIYKPNNKTEKRVSFSDKVIIHEVKEYHKCRKCPEIFEEYRVLKLHMKQLHRKHAVEFVDVRNVDITEGMVKKAIVDPKSKKTIISRYQCQNCSKYFSTNYCLNRHVETQHTNYENLQCKVCEETFVWPSLLRSHKCIRLNHPEMPFDDARPEIHFDNLNEIGQNGFDDLNIVDNDDYMHTLDFEIPAPIVELTEYENFTPRSQERFAPLSNLGYKIQTVQEVPIEF